MESRRRHLLRRKEISFEMTREKIAVEKEAGIELESEQTYLNGVLTQLEEHHLVLKLSIENQIKINQELTNIRK